MISRIFAVCAVVLGLAAASLPAEAADQPKGQSAAARGSDLAASEISPVADVEYARAALVYSPFYHIIRSKNVRKVVKPKKGIYCVKLPRTIDGKEINTQRLIPNVTPEWRTSDRDDLIAYYDYAGYDCPKPQRYVEVRTYQLNRAGRPVPSNTVGFTLTIP
ncbi:hypothetical protein [Microbaculum marinum]|uniref:Uncharacterized protein n=1 Tax=Microbaculum marinum TaxID=1764581 RepID=A0AAW9RZF3_9HYPH